MTRKRTRRPIQPLPPRGLRPRLTPHQRLDVAIIHIQTLDDLVHGRATDATLWDWVESLFTWSRAAELMSRGVPEMTTQLQIATAVITRYRSTGRIGLTGPEYQQAKAGLDVMDQLALIVDQARAEEAARWSGGMLEKVGGTRGTRPAR